ncbi:type VII toxin-antitoxin system HepT family RNase toxin [Desulfuromonas thiophila]|uniref:type VII toxin-antitoxin system HepT family RNase toxin n=1 Tax=Desulfuromonas thiophila TaxID=57664 RepID=UPI0024A9F282|nr:DUF86 domain-containing protein [Desulfuromonas thiophila]
MVDDYDLQDIITRNLERSIQQCVDIGLHIISDLEVPVPETMTGTFVALERAGCLNHEIAERMTKAVGFRNIAVHAYQQIDWQIVFAIMTKHLSDFVNLLGRLWILSGKFQGRSKEDSPSFCTM